MTTSGNLVSLLRNVPIRELVGALERDGFVARRSRGSQRVYRDDNNRRVVLHYHRGSDTLPVGTLSKFLSDTRWTLEDAQRLGIIR